MNKYTDLTNAQLTFVYGALRGRDVSRFATAKVGQERVKAALAKLDVALDEEDLLTILATLANDKDQSREALLRLIDVRQAEKRDEQKPVKVANGTAVTVAKEAPRPAPDQRAEVVDFAKAKADGDKREAMQRAKAAVESGDKEAVRSATHALKRAGLDPYAVLAKQQEALAAKRAEPTPSRSAATSSEVKIPANGTKLRKMFDLVTRPGGVTMRELLKTLGWKRCSATLGRVLRDAGVQPSAVTKTGRGEERRIVVFMPKTDVA